MPKESYNNTYVENEVKLFKIPFLAARMLLRRGWNVTCVLKKHKALPFYIKYMTVYKVFVPFAVYYGVIGNGERLVPFISKCFVATERLTLSSAPIIGKSFISPTLSQGKDVLLRRSWNVICVLTLQWKNMSCQIQLHSLFALTKTNNISLVTKLMSAKYLNKYAASKYKHSQATVKWGSSTDNYLAKTNNRT